jgi:hypothetical protein
MELYVQIPHMASQSIRSGGRSGKLAAGQCHKQFRVTTVNIHWIVAVHGCPKKWKKS